MYPYTICFIRQAGNILLLNRNAPPWMGMWNGIGGKIEPGETPYRSVLREIAEETGLRLETVVEKGVVTWTVDGEPRGGMYAFVAELPETFEYPTPVPTEEGILDWKSIDWILHPKNDGVAHNIPYFLNKMFNEQQNYNHHCVFANGKLLAVHSIPLTEDVFSGLK